MRFLYFLVIFILFSEGKCNNRFRRYAKDYVKAPNDYKYAGILKNSQNSKTIKFCNAGLLSPMIAITTADCATKSGKRLEVIMGTSNFIAKDKHLVTAEVDRVRIHPNYTGNYTATSHDQYAIGLLIFKKAVKLGRKFLGLKGRNVDSISFPTEPMKMKKGVFLSWGLDLVSKREEKVYLKNARLRNEAMVALDLDKCNEEWPLMKSSSVCAKSDNKESAICIEDRGGLLIEPGSLLKKDYLIGMLFYGNRECVVNANRTYLFVRMDFVGEWVQSVIDNTKVIH